MRQHTDFTTNWSKDAPSIGDLPGGLDEWLVRSRRLRATALVAMGLYPLPKAPPFTPIVTSLIERDDYTVENVYFDSLPGHYVTGNLYRPKRLRAPAPAVLAPHGHWPGGRWMWRSDEECEAENRSGGERSIDAARSTLQPACATLAMIGCVVFHYDMLGYCDSTDIPHTTGFTDAHAVLYGQSALGLQTWNGIRSIDFLASLPDVDPTRVAAVGASGGATQSIALAIVDDRVRAVGAAGMVSLNMQGGCVCENAPLYRVDTNNVELAALIAPRPIGFVSADDWTHDFATRGLPEITKIYSYFGAADQVEATHISHPHNFNVHTREWMYAFLNRRLSLGHPTPIREPAFIPVSPASLRVFTPEHPKPLDATDAAGVQSWFRSASARALAELQHSDSKEYRRVLRNAFRAMVGWHPSTREIIARADDRAAESVGGLLLEDGVLDGSVAGPPIPYQLYSPRGLESKCCVINVTEAEEDHTAAIEASRISGEELLVVTLPPKDLNPIGVSAESDGNVPYIGFTLGYNRSTLARRAIAVLTALAWFTTRSPSATLTIRASGSAAIATLVALAITDDHWDSAELHIGAFDCDSITDPGDPDLLPGVLRYGGITALVAVCDGGRLILSSPRSI